MMKRMLPALLGAMVGTWGAFALWNHIGPGANAAVDPDDGELPTVIPYSGRIERDGVTWDGDVDLSFRLATSIGGTTAWTEDWTASSGRAVEVHDGRFDVLLGTYENDALKSLVDDGGSLYLTVAVRKDASQEWTILTNAKPLRGSAFALWTETSGTLVAGGGITVTGAASVGGETHFGKLTMAHDGAHVFLGTDPSGTEKSGSYAVAFGDDNPNEGGQIAYRSSKDKIDFEKNFYIDDTTDLLSITAAGAMTTGGPTTVTGKTTFEGPLQLKSGVDMTLSSASRVTLAAGTGESSLSFKTSGGTKAKWAYSASANELGLVDGTTDMFTVESDGDVTTAYTASLQVNGKAWIAGTLSKSGQTDLEVDGADKLYVGDSSCNEGAIKGGTIDGAATICACFLSTPSTGDNQGRGWYCIN